MSGPRDLGIEGLRWVDEIGSGGFGSVHRASDDAHGRDVAVKLLYGSTDERSLQRFDRERKLMGSVSNHPNIVTIHTSGFTSQNVPYLVMELVEGGSLSERLALGTMSARATRDLGVMLAEAMCVAHDTGVLHLDIKPDNVLIGHHGEPQLADFGIASAASEISMRQTIAISPAFSPPELLNNAETDVRADVYSLAATLYRCVAGAPPYQQDGGGLLTTLGRMANEPVPRAEAPDMPLAMADLLVRAMAKDPAERPPTMRSFADALIALDFESSHAAAGEPVATAPTVVAPAIVPAPIYQPAAPQPIDAELTSTVAARPRGPDGPHDPAGALASSGGGGGGIAKPVIAVSVAILLVTGLALLLNRGPSADVADRIEQQVTQPTLEGRPTPRPGPAATSAPEPAPTLEGRPTPRPGPAATSAPEAVPTAEAVPPPATQETRSINVAVLANHPQMLNIQELTQQYFTDVSGIEVNYTAVEAGALREIVTRDVGDDAFDVVVLGMFDAPQLGAAGWLANLNEFAASDAEYDLDDIFPAVRKGLSFEGDLYASPFYSESSFLIYRADLLEDAGQTMPAAPTWDEVAAIARAVDSDDTAGICLRGRPGWGDLGASFTTMLNTFGGTWWAANDDGTIGESQVDQPEFAEALNFYVDLLNDAGQDDPANSSFGECRRLYEAGEVAMWYDSTIAAEFLEVDGSPVQGLNGYALAPVRVTDSSGWLWSWALAIPESAPDPSTAWEYISWATSKQYNEQVAGELGWSAVAPATRQSLFVEEGYQAIAGNFASNTVDAMLAVPIDNPGTTPRPGVGGVQMVGVPEFAEVGNLCTQQFSAAIAATSTVDAALAACHETASQFES